MIIIELFRIFGSILINDREARRGLQNVDSQAANTGNRLGALGRIGGVMGGMIAAGAVAAVGGMTVLSAAISKTGIGYNAMLENSQVAWSTLLGTQEKAKKMLQDIGNFAKTTQFETEQVDMMAKYMHNAGLEGQALFDELTKVADISGAFNIPAAEAKELTRQMSQVRQAGLAYTEDLNVLQDRGIPIYRAISKQLGITVADVKKMASEGKLTSDIYLKAFDEIAKGVKGSSEKQSKTFSGMISTLQDNLKMIAGELTKPLFEKLKNGLNGVMPVMDKFLDGLKKGGIQGGLATIFPPSVIDVIDRFGKALGTVKEGISGVFAILSGNTGGGISMLSRIGLGPEAIQIVVPVVEKIREALLTLKGAFSILTGDSIGGITFLTKMGFSPETITKVVQVVNGIRDAISNFVSAYVGYIKGLFSGDGNLGESFARIFNTAKSIIMPILSNIVSFIKEQLGVIKQFWDENGAQIIEAIKNVWSVIATIFEAIAPVIMFIINMLWTNVKGVISGALDVIMGLIKVFAGLFTGDWSKMWEGIKQLLGGALEAAWNLINLLMFGKILGGIKSFITKGGEFFTQFGAKAVEIFKNLDTYLFDFVKVMVSKVIGVFKGFVDEGVRVFGTLRTFGASIFQSLWAAIKTVVSNMASGVVGFFRNIFTGAKMNFEGILNSAKNIFNTIKAAITNPIETAHKIVVGFIDKIKSAFSNMGVKIPLPHFSASNFSLNPKDWIKNGLPKLSVDWYANGTNFAPGGLAVVGERGPELVDLPRGSKVHTANETSKLLKGGNTINVFSQKAVMDEKELGRVLQRLEVLYG